MKIFRYAFFLWMSVFGSVYALDVKDYDTDSDGVISDEEAKVFLMHSDSQVYETLDLNKDGEISDNEMLIHKDDLLTDEFDFKVLEFVERHGEGEQDFEEINYTFTAPEAPEPNFNGFNGWHLRRSYDANLIREVVKNNNVRKKEFINSEGALLSYARDSLGKNNIWIARGAFLYPKRKVPKNISEGTATLSDDEKLLTAYAFIPSISFDRVTNKNDEDGEVDNLTFRLGGEWEYTGGRTFRNQYYRSGLFYATDFDFESEILGIEAEWEPYPKNKYIPLGRPRAFGPVSVALDFALRSEFGRVYDTGNKSNLVDDDEFFRIGGNVGFKISPLNSNKLSWVTNWQYLYGISGEPDSTDIFESSIKYALDQFEFVTLELNYRNGEVPITLEETETYGLSFGVKF